MWGNAVPKVDSGRLYQNRISGIASLVGGGAVALAALSQLVSTPLVHAIAYVIIAIVALYFMSFRMGRGGLVVSAEGVRVRNPLKTSRLIPWNEVARCALGSWHGLPDVAFLELKDGRKIPITMLEIPPMERAATSVRQQIDEINALIEDRQSSLA